MALPNPGMRAAQQAQQGMRNAATGAYLASRRTRGGGGPGRRGGCGCAGPIVGMLVIAMLVFWLGGLALVIYEIYNMVIR
jgi:hypothetical protein